MLQPPHSLNRRQNSEQQKTNTCVFLREHRVRFSQHGRSLLALQFGSRVTTPNSKSMGGIGQDGLGHELRLRICYVAFRGTFCLPILLDEQPQSDVFEAAKALSIAELQGTAVSVSHWRASKYPLLCEERGQP